MSEHDWVRKNVAAYVAGGVGRAGVARIEEHATTCAECGEALREARALDDGLETLFAADRPGDLLEERLIRSVRARAERDGRRRRLVWRVGAGVAAAALLGTAGAGISSILDRELEAQARESLTSNLTQLGLGTNADRDGAVMALTQSYAFSPKVEEESVAIVDKADVSLSLAAPQRIYHRDAPKAGAGAPPPPDVAAFTIDPYTGADSRHQVAQMTSGKSVEFFKPADVTYRSPLAARGQVVTEGGDQDGKEGGKDPKPSGPMKPGEPAPTLNRPKAGEPVKPAPAADPAPQRKVIRTGEIEFEVESFDGAAAAVTKLVAAIKGGFVATVNSDKLPNGKVRGSVVVRVPPEHLDGLLLDLRRELAKGGELKGLRVGSQDVTKHYTDLESRLRAARTMEQRLLEIIKSGKGEIKALLEAEKELGVWRTKIEEFEGELRYLANQVGLSTLTVTLAEKSIAAAVGLVESERVQAGIEVEDVDKAQREALQAVADARGRVTKSELKQHAGGQFNAVLQFEVPHEAAGPLRDRLRQLGNVVRFEADRVQRTEGTGVAPRDGKVRRGETQFSVSLYNLANIAPRETATLRVAATEVPAAYRAIREAVAKAKGRVLNAQLNEQDRQNVSAQIDFDVRRADEGALQLALNDAGEVLSRHVTRAPEGENVTDAKVLFKVSLVGAATITPRETVTLGLEVNDVDQALAVISAHVKEAQGRVINSQVNQEPSGRVTASAHYDVPLSAAAGLAERLKAVGQVRTHQSTRNLQAPEGKLAVARFTVGVSNAELILPKNEGLWAQIRAGLSYSLRGLSLSVSWLIVAVLFVLPWALIVLGVVWVLRRLFGGREPVAAPATTGAANPQP